MLSLNKFFPYQWIIDDKEKEVTSIRVYGIDFEDKNVCVRINNFTPWVYIELPSDKEWTSTRAQILGNKIDTILGNNKPLKKTLLLREKLYNANIKIHNNNIEKKQFPYLFCTFSSVHDIKQLCYKVKKPIPIVGIGLVKIKIHEQDADPILQLVSCKNIKTAGWIEFSGNEILGNEKITLCDKEYVVKWKNLKNYECDIIGKPKIMGFDIEVNSTNVTAMPKSEKPGDKIFQISCVFAREGSLNQDSYLLTLGKADNVGENVKIYCYETESDLLLGFTKLVRTENPNVIVGYNILGFDIQYMIDRAKFNLCLNTFDIMGFHKYNHSQEKTINWSSSAYKNQEFSYLDAEGRLFVDLLPLVRRDYKLNKYDLGTVSEYFLGDQKKDLNAKGIFKCYRIGTKKNDNGTYGEKAITAMNKCGLYCIQDSVLVMKLMDKLQTWVGLTEMACTFNTQIFTLYTQGQQIKVYSQVYKFCTYNNIVVEKDGYITKDTDRYVGAHVFPPVPGIYDRVLPFDFASLYPTTIIAYNIDYSTFVVDEKIPDSMCHVLSWSDHISCDHDPKIIRKKELTQYIDKEKILLKELRDKRDKTKDKIEKQKIIEKINNLVEKIKPYTDERSAIMKTISKNPMCEKRYYRFLKEPRGVIPTILQFLLDARKKTRAQIKENNKKIANCTDPEEIKRLKLLNNVLNKRQLAYKVSANSMYGAMGVKRGYLPFMPGAMCTTYLGRCNIEKVSEVIPKKYGGELVYGDTDCVLATEPVLIKNNNNIEYKTVEEISDGKWTRINQNKEISKAKLGYQIWSDTGFTDIINVVRCGIKKPLSRILVHTGVISCSNEHSLLTEKLESVTPLDVKVGDKLCISHLPLPPDTPKKPIYINKLTKEVIEEYIIADFEYEGLTAELAFVWGLFFADGSCGEYLCGNGYNRSTWAICKKDNKLLERACDILIRNEKSVSFKILDTMKSSNVNKLVAIQFSKKSEHAGSVINLVNKYRDLFYDNRKNKKIPSIIFNSPLEIRQSFFMGYYAGDGSKKDSAISISNKGAIGSAGLFYIMRSIGYQVSINTRNDKPDIFKLTGSTPEKKQRYETNKIKKIIPIEPIKNEYIYDIQTENHHFSVGVGELVVHNSNYIHFPHLKEAKESWEYAEMVAEEVSKLFPKPIKLEYEEVIYWRFFILTKKRYMYLSCGKDGIVDKVVGKKGVLLARRDCSFFIRDLYEKVVEKIFERVIMDDILYFIIMEINKMCSNCIPIKNFAITKSLGSIDNGNLVPFITEKNEKKLKMGNYILKPLPTNEKERLIQIKKKDAVDAKDYYMKSLPAIVQLAEKMRKRGKRVDAGSRLEYVITDNGVLNDKQYNKVEDIDYFNDHNSILKIDFMYYLKLLTNPLDQVLNIAFNKEKNFKKDFILYQYDFRNKNRRLLLQELNNLFKPKLIFGN